jgi:hypothetical protein
MPIQHFYMGLSQLGNCLSEPCEPRGCSFVGYATGEIFGASFMDALVRIPDSSRTLRHFRNVP